MFDMVTLGSATVDVFVQTDANLIAIQDAKTTKELLAYPLGTKILIKDLHFEIGGGGTNTAVSFARLGFNTAYVGSLGDDEQANKVITDLSRERVSFIGVKKKGHKTNFSVVLDSQSDDRTILTHRDASDALSIKDVPELAYQTRWMYASSMVGTSFTTLKKVFSRAKEQHISTAFNPSAYQAQLGWTALAPLLKFVDVLIFNKEEAQALLRTDKNIPSLLRVLHERGIHTPVITDGSRGAWCLMHSRIFSTLPARTKIRETTGAGDAFASGFISGLMHHYTPADCLRLGMMNAESVITHLGAKNILLSKKHAERALKKDRRVVQHSQA